MTRDKLRAAMVMAGCGIVELPKFSHWLRDQPVAPDRDLQHLVSIVKFALVRQERGTWSEANLKRQLGRLVLGLSPQPDWPEGLEYGACTAPASGACEAIQPKEAVEIG